MLPLFCFLKYNFLVLPFLDFANVCFLNHNVFLSSSFDGHDEEDSVEHDEATADGNIVRNGTDSKLLSYQLPPWLSDSTPDEFIVCAFDTVL